MKLINGGVCAAKGFQANGVHCGIRKNKSKRDLALIFSTTRAAAACVYTTNLVKGAPLKVTKEHISDGYASAIICNSGNANTCNANGIEIAEQMSELIANKLDRLVSPEDMLMKKWDTVKEDIERCVYEKEDYHPEIAAVLNTRLLNYSVNYLKDGNKADVVCNRLLDLIDNSNSSTDRHLFSEDLIFSIIKTIVAKFPAKTNKLLLNPAVRKKIL